MENIEVSIQANRHLLITCYIAVGIKDTKSRASPVAQWLRICPPVQEMWVQYRACPHAAEQRSPRAATTEAHTPQSPALQQEEPLQ